MACSQGEARPTASVSVSGAGVQPGVVQPRPSSAAQVDVVLQEWSVRPSTQTVRAGEVYFLADNQGPDDPHELVIVKSDLTPDRLPVKDGKVPEDQVNFIGEIEAFAPKSKASGVFNLQPGRYVLLCNIAEIEGGTLESHFQLGMRTTLTVN
jgi:hypothetical protein